MRSRWRKPASRSLFRKATFSWVGMKRENPCQASLGHSTHLASATFSPYTWKTPTRKGSRSGFKAQASRA